MHAEAGSTEGRKPCKCQLKDGTRIRGVPCRPSPPRGIAHVISRSTLLHLRTFFIEPAPQVVSCSFSSSTACRCRCGQGGQGGVQHQLPPPRRTQVLYRGRGRSCWTLYMPRVSIGDRSSWGSPRGMRHLGRGGRQHCSTCITSKSCYSHNGSSCRLRLTSKVSMDIEIEPVVGLGHCSDGSTWGETRYLISAGSSSPSIADALHMSKVSIM